MRNVILGIVTLCAAAQAQSGAIRLRKQPLSVVAGVVQVDVLSSPTADSDWVVAFEARPGEPTAAIGEVALSSADAGKRPDLSSLRELAPGAYSSVKGTAILDLRRSTQSGVVFYARVPAGTRVRVTADGRTVVDTAVASSLLVHAGTLLPEPATFAHAFLTIGRPPAPTVDFVDSPTGAVVVSPAFLKRQLIEAPTLPVLTALATRKPPTTASIVFHIDSTGTVRSSSDGRGDAELLKVIQAALRSWKFKPLTRNGKAVSVEAPLAFLILPDGTITSPLR